MTEAQSKTTQGYNERLFSGKGLRSYLHNSRFEWFKKTLIARGFAHDRVIELGCFDGRLLSYFKTPPAAYHGFDADWEGGLTKGQEKYADHPSWQFTKSADPQDLSALPDNSCDIAVALETLEHIPLKMIDDYLSQLARITDGVLVVSVPNEKGVVFLAKWTLKKLMFGGAEKYTVKELISAVFGRMDQIERNEHKGFDHAALAKHISQHFDLIAVQGIPAAWMPVPFAFTVGIIAKSKPKQPSAG